MRFYEKYLRLCNEKGLSPSKVGEEIGLSRSAVSRWANGQAVPSAATVLKLSEFFGVPVSYFGEESRVEPFKPDFQLYAQDKSVNKALYETAQVRVLIDTFMQLDEIKKAKLLVYAAELAQQ